MLERFADECHVTAAWPEEEASLLEAIECHRHAGDKLGEGRTNPYARRRDCVQGARARTGAHDATAGNRGAGAAAASLQLAQAYLGISSTFLANEEAQPAFEWAQRARELAGGSADPDFEARALGITGSMEWLAGAAGGSPET